MALFRDQGVAVFVLFDPAALCVTIKLLLLLLQGFELDDLGLIDLFGDILTDGVEG